jgi:hypothetical protein
MQTCSIRDSSTIIEAEQPSLRRFTPRSAAAVETAAREPSGRLTLKRVFPLIERFLT